MSEYSIGLSASICSIGAMGLEDYTVLNGKDIVPGWGVYHARWEK